MSVKEVFKHFPVDYCFEQTESSSYGNPGFTLLKGRVPPMGTKTLEQECYGVAHAPLRTRRQIVVGQSADILYVEEFKDVVNA